MIGKFKISVIIPTYNPGLDNLTQTLNGLKKQDLALNEWECIIVDNASTNATLQLLDVNWHPNLKIVKELKQGLTFARLKGFEESNAGLLLLVDDDNVLDPDYLTSGIALFEKIPGLGVAGGKSTGSFESEPAEWVEEFYSMLAVRPEKKQQTITNDLSKGYPDVSPIGAGMFVSRVCFKKYEEYIKSSKRVILDRNGSNLSSGGDNEINILALKNGYSVGYFPELNLKHLITSQRLQPAYLKRLNFSSNRSWVKLLAIHGISPWQPISKITLIPRKIKAFFKWKPWRNHSNAIKYAGVCGMFKGLSELK